MSALKTRHAATLSTLTSTSYSLASNLRSAENTIERLRTSLDELGKEIMKETYGRRREVALRIRLLGREEKMLEGLRRWLRKGEEAVSDTENEVGESHSRVRAVLLGMTQDARILLEGLDDGLVTDSASLSGSLARVVLAQALADGLVEELKMETARRMDLEQAVSKKEQDTSLPIVTLNGYDLDQRPPVSDKQENSAYISSSPTSAPPLEITTIQPSDPEPNLSKEAQPSTTILLDAASSDTNPLDIPSSTTQNDPIPPDSTLLTDDTITAPNEYNPPLHTHQSDNLNSNQASAAVSPEQSTPPSSTLIPDVVIDVAIVQPPDICANTVDSVLEEAGVDKNSELIIIQTDVALQNVDSSVEPSSVPAVVEPGPTITDDPTPSPLPSSPPNLFSVVDPAVTSNPIISLPITSSTGQLPILAEKEKPKSPTPHPLLAELAKISHRYDDFQRSFRDCHLALEDLKASLSASSSATSSNHQFNPSSIYTSRPAGDKPPELVLTPMIPIDILHAAVSRLDDYTEDVRVEVEIRISDEEVLAKGYEVLLCVPGALYSSSTPAPSLLSPALQPYQDYDKDQSFALEDSQSVPPTQSELEIQVQAFIAGTDPSVTKACEGFTRKLEDVQHDIAVLKRAIHDPNPEEMMSDGHEFSSQTPTVPETGGRGWASWIRSSSGPSTPVSATTTAGKHLGPSPTFGSIMTSPHRLKHSPSLNMNGHANGPSWMQRGGGGRGGGRDDILGRLGLRVPMPIFDSVHQPVPPSSSPASMEGWGWNGLSPTMPTPIKKRSVSSTMYMLGLGAAPMMTATRSRGPSNSYTTESQKGEDSVGVGSVNETESRGPIGLVEMGRVGKVANIRHDSETTDEETEEDDGDVE